MKRGQKHFLGKSVEIGGAPCLNCQEWLDGATGVDHRNRPYPGATTVCMYCGHIMVFADDLTFREPTDEEMVEIAGNPSLIMIQQARAGRRKQ
jgi:hypothetical protein